MNTLAREQAAEEVLRRRQIRSSLLEWAKLCCADKGWVPAAHHVLLLNALQQVTDGELKHPQTGLPCRNLMVLMPPGSAKSTYISIIFPPWFIQRRPNCRILACSHASDLIESFSRECRNLVDAHHKILGFNLLSDSRAIQEWSTTNTGTYRCAGVGAGLSGRRADAGIIDDYLGSQEDADSKLIREKQWAWYKNDFWPRLKPNAIQIIVANRRHEEDLVGKILEKDSLKWVVIRLPFFAEENDALGRKVGEYLWPEWFTEEMATEIKLLSPRTQAGLYQQRPAPEEGNFFKRDWLVEYTREQYDELMASEPRIYGAGDWAVSEEAGANRTCFGGVAVDSKGVIYVLPDLFWKVAGPEEVVINYVDFLKRRNPLIFWSEKGHITKAWGPFLREAMLDQEVYNYISEVTPSKDKEMRAQSIRGRMAMLRVRFPKFTSWWPAAEHELLTFPGGKTDDLVDFLAHIGMGLQSIVKSSPRKPQPTEDLNVPWKPTLSWLKNQDKQRRLLQRPKYAGR